jgi:programmed cell death protein 5
MYEDEGEVQRDQNSQKRLKKALMDRLKRQQLEEQKKEIIKRLIDNAAYSRLMNIKLSNYELYSQLIDLIIQLAQTNRIRGKLTEEQFVEILKRATERRETTLEYKHK